MTAALKEKRAATNGERYKSNMPKYKTDAPALGLDFKPITFEETGRMGTVCEKIMKDNNAV